MIDYLEGDFRAHCSPVGDDGLVVGVFAVPAVELDAAAARKQNLYIHRGREKVASNAHQTRALPFVQYIATHPG